MKASPPVAVTVWQYVFGLPVEKYVAAATLIYIVLQAYFLVTDRLEKRMQAKLARQEVRHAAAMACQHATDTGKTK